MRKLSMLLVLCLLLGMGAFADEWTTETDPKEGFRLLYRIPVDAPRPSAIPEALNDMKSSGPFNIRYKGSLYDFGRSEARRYIASPPEFDIRSMLLFFWKEPEVEAALASAEVLASGDDSFWQYRNGDEVIRVDNRIGRIRYEREGLNWSDLNTFSTSFWKASDYVNLPAQAARTNTQQEAVEDASRLLQLLAIDAEPLLTDAFGTAEMIPYEVRQVEIYSFALAYDGIPASNLAQELPNQGDPLPQQELKLVYDDSGLVSLYLTTFHFEPEGEFHALDLNPAAEMLWQGKGGFLFGYDFDVSLILLCYLPVSQQDDGYLYVPAWCMCDMDNEMTSSWFTDTSFAWYNAFDGAPIYD